MTAHAPAAPSAHRGAISRIDIVLTLVAAYSLALGLPLMDLMRQNVAFFVAHNSRPVEIVLFAAVAASVIPLLIAGFVAALKPRPLREAVHGLGVGLLLASFAGQILERLAGSSLAASVVVGLAVAAGAGGAVAVNRLPSVRQFFRYLGWAPLPLVILFLLSPSISAAIAPDAVAGRSVDVGGSESVVVVVFDELPVISLLAPDGRINRQRYPNFARLSELTTWYRDASTAGNTTIEAVPSLLTGRYPRPGRLPIFNHHMENLFTLLGGSHRVVAAEPMTQLCPARVCGERRGAHTAERLSLLARDSALVAIHIALPEQFERSLPEIDDRWASFGGEDTDRQGFLDEVITPQLRGDRVGAFDAFVGSIRSSQQPTLYFHHSLVPHRPWRYLPDGSVYTQSERVPGQTESVWGTEEWLVAQGLQRHLLQAGLADKMIGALLDRLEAEGMLESTYIVVAADHGVAFDPEKPMRHLDDFTIGSVFAVPLFITIPGAEGEVVDTPVELVDALPTLAELLGAKADGWRFDGQSLLAEPDGEPRLVLEGGEMLPVQDLAANRDAALTRWDQRAPMGGGWDELFRAGPNRQILGMSISDFDISPADWTAFLDDAAKYEAVELDSGVLPVMLTGYIEGLPVPESGIDLVVSVNGMVAAVTHTFNQAKPSMFSALVPMSALGDGVNQIGIYAMNGAGDLQELRVQPADVDS